jgi:AraC-like DNA-binding protein
MFVAVYENRIEATLLELIRSAAGLSKSELIYKHVSGRLSYRVGVEAAYAVCDFNCSLHKCYVKLSALKCWTGCPVIIFRRLQIISPMVLKNTFVMSFLGKKKPGSDLNWITTFLSSPSCACSPTWVIHPSRPFFKVAKIQAITSDESSSQHSLLDLSAKVGWSQPWLSRTFKKYTGMGLEEYMIRLKLCSALWRIMDSTDAINEIAYDLGYNDALYFSKMFKRRFGSSPSSVRKVIIW